MTAAAGARAQATGLSPTADERVVSDPAAGTTARAEAARRLLLADDNQARQAVASLLKPADPPGPLTDAQRLLVTELSRLSWAPARLGRPLRDLLATAKGEDRHVVIAALASVRTAESARTLIETAERAQESAVRDAAFAALIRMTGRADLGQDVGAWRGWFARVEFLDDAAWQRTLAESLAARTDQLTRANEQTVERLVREKRERFRAIPLENGVERSRYIAGLLADPAGAVRTLGVELANDELANARTPGAAVSGAALSMLSDPEPRFRRLGADLLEKLAPDGVGGAVNDALIRETDPAAAAALLSAARRWPERRIVPVVLRWLENGPSVRPAALSTIVKLDRDGLLTHPEHIRRAMQAVRGMGIREMGTAGVQLLARRGDQVDIDWVVALLSHEDIAIRMAAAEGLAGRREGVDPLVAAAREDPAFFAAAATALQRYERNDEGFKALLALPAPTPEVRLERIRAMAAVLSPVVICDVGCAEQDTETREVILARLEPAAWWWVDQRPWISSSRSPSWLRGLLELAETRLTLGRPAEALEALKPLEAISVEPALTARIRVMAMVWLNRLDEAASVEVPAEVWVTALERITSLPHAGAALARFDALYAADRLDDALRARLARIRELLRPLAKAPVERTGVQTPAGGG